MAGRFISRLFGGPGSDDNPITSIRGANTPWLWRKLIYTTRIAANWCQVLCRELPTGVFVGIYDGHGGDICSQFVLNNLFRDLKDVITSQDGFVDPAAFKKAYEKTERKFFTLARAKWEQKPRLAAVGSCCLSGIVHNRVLYVANAGDSRAVLARWEDGNEQSMVLQLSRDHNTNNAESRAELAQEHPNDSALFDVVNETHLVRGKTQVTRSLGDFYLKSNEFNRPPLEPGFRLEEPILLPILKSEPTFETHQLGPHDRFVIFASDGLWKELTNEEAVSVVKASARSGAAKALLEEALARASHRNNMDYQQLIEVPIIDKRNRHDDISIIILFFDN
ncbi:Protein phosphatase 2C [Rhynchospora pubera]|uniref:protein-serine/threonine phosphatase n=1 Tax=Rhynchospora pubera TaxID=906938 RepID=A0AAV8EXT5_9POAL|nr:Protein phosphatase 2C [Rhynchospora pubera]